MQPLRVCKPITSISTSRTGTIPIHLWNRRSKRSTALCAGKVRAIGASNYDAARLQQALMISGEKKIASYTVLQPWYNLLEREKFEGPLQDLCVAQNIAAVPYYGLASGFLTGKYRSQANLAGQARGGAVEKYLNQFGFGVLSALDTVAAQAGATPAQVALAWLAAQPGVAAPIASADHRGPAQGTPRRHASHALFRSARPPRHCQPQA